MELFEAILLMVAVCGITAIVTFGIAVIMVTAFFEKNCKKNIEK